MNERCRLVLMHGIEGERSFAATKISRLHSVSVGARVAPLSARRYLLAQESVTHLGEHDIELHLCDTFLLVSMSVLKAGEDAVLNLSNALIVHTNLHAICDVFHTSKPSINKPMRHLCFPAPSCHIKKV